MLIRIGHRQMARQAFSSATNADEIKEAENVKVETLRDPQKDEDRVKKPEWLIMVGMYTTLTT